MKKLKEGTKITIMIIGASLFGIMPLIAMLFIYVNDPNSPFLNSIYEIAKSYPEISLPRNPILSESMSLYLKTAPIQAILSSLFYYKLFKITTLHSIKKYINSFLGISFFTFLLIYLFLIRNEQLTQTKGLFPFLYTNDYLLTLYFAMLFIIIFYFSVCCISLGRTIFIHLKRKNI